MNIDATIDANKGIMGYGVILQKHGGLVMVIGIAQWIFSNDVDVAKAEALCFGL